MINLKKIIAVLLALALSVTVFGCGNGDEGSSAAGSAADGTSSAASDSATGTASEAGAEGYTFGVDTTFHSDEPVTYSMMYSDHENYPYKEDWLLWSAIEDKTNVSFDLNIIARTDYEDKKSTLVNTGDAEYIIPKTYSESAYVASGQIVPVSDYVQYMPNYMKCVEDWDVEGDLKQKLQADGKYYVLPGIWQSPGNGYSLLIRKDVFDAAGVDVEALEKTWTWEDFYDACKKVKEYTGGEYVWSDQYNGACAMNMCAKEYGVKAGRATDGGNWGLDNGVKFNWDDMQFYFADATDEFKDFLTFWNKMYTDGIMDPETYSQDSDTAQEKFFSGKSYVLSVNYQQLADIQANQKVQVDDAELYMTVCPGGPAGMYQYENSKLENGIMISTNALNDLGEEEFIKMLRFVDWLWYSEEGHMLSQWGVEGETYTIEDNKVVLNSDIYFNGINEGAAKKLNVDFGFGGGVFAYGGSDFVKESKMTEGEIDFTNRIQENRELLPIDPPIMSTEEEAEELNLIQTPLMDFVNTSTLEFITGRKSLETDWDQYLADCESKGAGRYIDSCNEIFANTRETLGY